MTDEELTEKLAVDVMGWEWSSSFMAYFPTNRKAVVLSDGIFKKEFQPLTDWNHLMMCVQKILPTKSFHLEWYMNANGDLYAVAGDIISIDVWVYCNRYRRGISLWKIFQ